MVLIIGDQAATCISVPIVNQLNFGILCKTISGLYTVCVENDDHVPLFDI